MLRKMFEHFCHAKMFWWGQTFFLHFFNQIAYTQKIARWYMYIQGISKPNEKQKMRAVSIGFLLHTLFKASCNFFLPVTKGNKSYKNPSTSIDCFYGPVFWPHAQPTARLVGQSLQQDVTFLGLQCWKTQAVDVTWKSGFTHSVDAKTIFPSLNSWNYIEFQDNIKVMATF